MLGYYRQKQQHKQKRNLFCCGHRFRMKISCSSRSICPYRTHAHIISMHICIVSKSKHVHRQSKKDCLPLNSIRQMCFIRNLLRWFLKNETNPSRHIHTQHSLAQQHWISSAENKNKPNPCIPQTTGPIFIVFISFYMSTVCVISLEKKKKKKKEESFPYEKRYVCVPAIVCFLFESQSFVRYLSLCLCLSLLFFLFHFVNVILSCPYWIHSPFAYALFSTFIVIQWLLLPCY